MLEGLRRLVDLSRVDGEIAALEDELSKLPGRREACAQAREACAARVEAARTAVAEAEHTQRQGEGELRDREALLAKLEGQQHQVKTNEAYTALLHEMEQARQGISDAETRILEAMEAIEQARAELARAGSGASAETVQIDEEERSIEAREAELGERLAGLRTRRDAVRGSLEPELLERYDKISARRRPAVAIVSKETCMGCRVGVPPQTSIELMRGEAILHCGYCHRILVHEEHLRGE